MSLLSHRPSHATATDGALLSDSDGPLTPRDLRKRFEGRIAVVIPAYGEAENLAELLPRMPSEIDGVGVSVLVVDDGSDDDTAGVALRAGAVLARLAENRGGGAALRVGYAAMVEARASVLITMDADGQHQPEELAMLAGPVLSGRAELVQGSRILGSSEPGTFARELGIALFNRLVRLLTRVPVTDCSNSFRAIRTELLGELDLRQAQFHAAEFLIEAITRGLAFEEVPVSVLARQHGHSKKPPTLRYGLGFSSAIITAWSRSVLRRAATGRASRPARAAAAERAPAGPLGLTLGGRSAPVEDPQREREQRGGARVADLEALQLVAHDSKQHPGHEQGRDG
jgi:hypothetical protein